MMTVESLEAVSSSSDGHGGVSAPGKPGTKPAHRYIYYRLYTRFGGIESNKPIYSNDRFIGRTLASSVAPPRTGASLKRHLCRIEGFEGLGKGSLYPSLSATTTVEDSARLSLRGDTGPGSSENVPMALVFEISDVEKRLATSTVDLKTLPERLGEPRYVYYRVFEIGAGVFSSKTSFNRTNSLFGRLDILSIPPPHTVSSLKSCLVRVEGISSPDVQLFEGFFKERVMNDGETVALSSDHYPGNAEDKPITILIESQKSTSASKPQVSAPSQDPAFSRQIKVKPNCASVSPYGSTWHSRTVGEIFTTDGILRTTRGRVSECLCYEAINSAGKKGFIPPTAVDFC